MSGVNLTLLLMLEWSKPEEPVWLHPHLLQSHGHEPNPAPPSSDTTLQLVQPDGTQIVIAVANLVELPQQSIDDCYIVSTGHGTSGPFRFEGVTLANLLTAAGIAAWEHADVISADGFGTRIHRNEIDIQSARPILLALACNGERLTREQGLVRLIVPSESDDALRQVKWVARIELH